MTQLDFGEYASPPAARPTDPDTSQVAAVSGQRGRSKRAVLAQLAQVAGATDEQLAHRLPHLPRGSASKRRLDLCRLGLVEEMRLHGHIITARTQADHAAIVWRLTPLGVRVARLMEDDGLPTSHHPRVTVERDDLEYAIRLIDRGERNDAITLLRRLLRSP